MASYKLFVVCVILCTVQSGHSLQIQGTISNDMIAFPREVTLLKYINGEDFNKIMVLKLYRLVHAKTVPALTLVNFKPIDTLNVTNIALERVPVFVNTSCTEIHITGNKIKSVPANAFSRPQPSYLDLSNNEIQSMADRSINIGASEVFLHCNKIGHFSQSWFKKPGNIVVLRLDGNRIEYIEDQAFSQMTKLYTLELGYNRITSIGSEAFSSGIVNLILEFNEIAQLTPDMFAHRNISMSDLYLHHNQLGYLPEALLLKVKPKQITLFGNPWQCQCLRDIERWLRELNSTRWDLPSRRGEPVCVVPANFQNICVPAVDQELQQTYARALSPVPECLAIPCQCKIIDLDFSHLT